MDLAAYPKQKIYSMSREAGRELKILLIALGVSAIMILVGVIAIRDWRVATNIGLGAAFATVNITFYGIVALGLVLKKNIAWLGPVIVIKYLFLLVSVYLIWAHSDVLLVLVGMFSQITLVAVCYLLLKYLHKRKKDGSF